MSREEAGTGILDANKDGWDDLWCAVHPQIVHRDRQRDTDGDGLTDYEEMLLWTNPSVAEGSVRPPTEEQKKEAAQRTAAAEDAAEARQREALAATIEAGQRTARQALPENARLTLPSHDAAMDGLRQSGEQIAAAQRQRAAAAQATVRDPSVRRLVMGPEAGGTLIGFENGLPIVIGSNNLVGADTISADELWPGGASPVLDLSGVGRTMGIWEASGGPLVAHNEFAIAGGGSRVAQLDDPLAETQIALAAHPTQVAGTLLAAGLVNGARGVSFGAFLRAFAAVGDTGEMASEAAAGMCVSNHSYGQRTGWVFFTGLPNIGGSPPPPWLWFGPDIAGEDPNFGYYSSVSRGIDLVVYDAKRYLPVWAAGNDAIDTGPAPGATYWRFIGGNTIAPSTTLHPADGGAVGSSDTLVAQSAAKNNLVVGAVGDLVGGYQGAAAVALGSFSSRGPTDDGRIKPDVVADGITFLSTHYEIPPSGPPLLNLYTDGSAAGRAAVSGTSFAAPTVSGSINLLQDLNQQYGSTPLWASTWRALIIHTADDSGVADGAPDYLHGWGLVNTRRAAEHLEANAITGSRRSHIRQAVLFNGQTIQIPVVTNGTQPLRVTIAWTDPAFQTTAIADLNGGIVAPAVADPPGAMLINDVDLRLIRPGVATVQPWVLNPAAPTTSAARGDNFRDNVEQVFVNDSGGNAPAGTYTIRITHKGTLRVANALSATQYELTTTQGRQDVAVLISGNVPQQSDRFALISLDKLSTQHILTWSSVPGIRYQAENSQDLATWTPVLGPINATAATTALTIPVSSPSARLFYRVREVGIQ